MNEIRPLCDHLGESDDSASGALRAELRAHAEACEDCALDETLQRDMAAEGGPRPDDELLIGTLVQEALEAEPAPSRRRGGSWVRLPAAAAVLLFVSAGAGAALWKGAALWREGQAESTVAATPPTAEAPVNRRSLRPSAPVPAEEPPSVEGPPSVAASPPPARSRRVASPRRFPTSPAALFAEGNRLRQAGDYRGAALVYRELSRSFTGSPEELTARVILGQLSLDRLNDPDQALALFESYLRVRSAGSLAQEARFAKALALGRLSRPGEEREAWRDLLRAHPRSVYATEARKRLGELR